MMTDLLDLDAGRDFCLLRMSAAADRCCFLVVTGSGAGQDEILVEKLLLYLMIYYFIIWLFQVSRSC